MTRAWPIALGLLLPTPAIADDAHAGSVDELTDEELLEQSIAAAELIEVEDRAPAEAASSVHFTADELRLRPSQSASDLLRQTPGLAVVQHAGGGKADQYFMRGFDADHGTDVALFADGIPINLTSHAHGQGYADAHWIIPETIATIDVHKGPYAARYGDFYTAGAIEMRTIDELDRPTLWLTGGTELTGPVAARRLSSRMVGMATPEVGGGKALLAAEVSETDGPFIAPQDFQRGTVNGKWQRKLGAGKLRLATTFYAASWNQSGQIPAGEVEAGRLDRFGTLDETEGGSSQRASIAAGYQARSSARARNGGSTPTPSITDSSCSRTSPCTRVTPNAATRSNSSTTA
jgi:outer membrane receptor protein involved in Fe transport